MDELTTLSHEELVRRMFGQIAPRYDLMNRLISGGQDLRWRRLAVQAAKLESGDRLLDVAAGTGDMVFLAQALVSDLSIIAADLTLEMMRVGKGRTDSVRKGANGARPEMWTGADTYALPFASDAFDAVTSAFLLRNLTDPLAGLQEQVRVLRPGGRLVMLDATPPPETWLRPLIQLYLNRMVPALGSLVAGRAEAYRYLPASIANFMRPAVIASLFEQAGLEGVYHRSFMLGTAAMVVGVKPFGKGMAL